MNHIKRLQIMNNARAAALVAMQNAIIEFRAHLQSEKFWEDTTIQVDDVQRRLDMIVEAGDEVLRSIMEKEGL